MSNYNSRNLLCRNPHNMFPERIKQLRIENNFTQKDIGHRLNMTRQGYGYYERGERRMTLSMMSVLSDIYQADIMEFILLELSDFNIDLPRNMVRELEDYGSEQSGNLLKPGYTLEQVSKTEYLLLAYYRSLPLKIKNDIDLFLKNKKRCRRTGSSKLAED